MTATIQRVEFVGADEHHRERGLLGWVSLRYGELALSGITLRRTLDGRLALSFPERKDGTGRMHPYIRPIDDEARREIEAAVLGALGLDREAAP